MTEKRVRFVASGLKVRETGEESRVIEGCAIVFNQETTLYEGKYGRECEIIKPSCITAEFLKEQDIKLNLLHDRYSSVARNNKGEGTLKLDLREDGLYFEAEMPRCDLGDQALELVRNRTYTGCSFEFYPKDYSIVNRSADGEKEDYLVVHNAFERVTALTIAMDPAYEQTSVSAREEYEELTKNEQRLKQQEDEEREGRHLLAVREAEKARERALAIMATECL